MTTKKNKQAIDSFKSSVLSHLTQTSDAGLNNPSERAVWKATCAAVNEIIFEKVQTSKSDKESNGRRVSYLSMEYLIGRLLSNNLHSLGLYEIADEALAQLGLELTDILEEGADLALGNGGLGRLAACYLDSLATLDFEAVGYGVHYQNGLFRQSFKGGRQVESPDQWREFGNPWEICREELRQIIPLFGHVSTQLDADGKEKRVWSPGKIIQGVPWDIPVVGYASDTVNTLRLWESRAVEQFDWDEFNRGHYLDAHEEQVFASTICKVVYPNDETEAGRELRFIQQYFFCACSIKDIIRKHIDEHGKDWGKFTELEAIQLNDTHPTIAILELMRLLLDEHGLEWKDAWSVCSGVFAYTNHTLLPEALETWDIRLFQRILPRHLEILFHINQVFLDEEVDRVWPNNPDMRAKLSIIEEGGPRKVRMANLCVLASHKVNGVAAIHSELVKTDLFPEFHQLWPEKLTNVTNGITPRRWLKSCNPRLSALLDERISGDWAKSLDLLAQLEQFADDPVFQQRFMQIKHQNKLDLCEVIERTTGIEVSADAIFDVQIKRLHEYKRQHLNLLHILALYRRLRENPDYPMQPRVFIFAAKAAPGYYLAKEIIYAINCVAAKVNSDPRIDNKLKVVFIPNYRVSLAEKIIPAADVSEQISTAGKEASGTGNMKLALNGAVTIGTLDGANIEIAEEVGDDNIVIFGHTVDEIKALQGDAYDPNRYYQENQEIKACLDWLDTDFFTPEYPGELSAIKRSLLHGGDPYRVLADFESYSEAHKKIDAAYSDPKTWAKMAIINTAKMGKFTSDRSIMDYARGIWKLL